MGCLCSVNWRAVKGNWSKRSFFAAGACSGRVYVAGEHDENKNALRTGWVYDLRVDEWTELPPMSQERDECEGVVMGLEMEMGMGGDGAGNGNGNGDGMCPSKFSIKILILIINSTSISCNLELDLTLINKLGYPSPLPLIPVPYLSVKTVGLKRPHPPSSTPGDAWGCLGSASMDDGYFRRNYSALAVAVVAAENEEEEVGESEGEQSDQGEGEEKEGIDLVSFFCLFCVSYVYFLS
ncbi:hypothetical protein SLEP1_g53547 [Rubroshorea leprosula]|uniref:Galactose oxidase/kelch repeat superfamily protein n=1 Tax=Rubroshorea leprosula TaxID=152421 RepID=A0AAV5MAL5_9ROSI|nr:hypothetical protein SLEP1_g53547 [Rubroshorea leprosula]